MEQIRLESDDRRLQVWVDPQHGGMVTQIRQDGCELLHLDTVLLQTAPMPSGGMPILFPFASKTANDTYQVGDKTYTMPMHGLVKNSCFALEQSEEKPEASGGKQAGESGNGLADNASGRKSVTLWIDNNGAGRTQNYPFDFKLTVTYTIDGQSLRVSCTVENRSDEPMPHAMGLHPFFRAGDKSRMKLAHNMKQMYDYERCEDCSLPDTADLSAFWDHVFFLDEKDVQGSFRLENEEFGYAVSCQADPAFRTMVLCSHLEGSMCVEPWCGIPNSANNGRFLQWIDGHTSRTYTTVFSFA